MMVLGHTTGTGARVEALQARLEQENLDGFLVTHFANRRYLSGYSANDYPPNETSGFLLITRQKALLITSFLYAGVARQETQGFEVITFGNGTSFVQKIANLIIGCGLRRVGFESIAMIFDFYLGIVQSLENKAELLPMRGFIESLRMVKDCEELAIMRQAIQISDRAFNEVEGLIQPGITEKQLAWEIERRVREFGGEALAFDTIVASGPNGSSPHAVPTERPFEPGDPVMIDMGARYMGYNSDMTRTVSVAGPTARYKEIYNIVLQAQLGAIQVIRPGISGGEADAVARDIISSYGYGETFGHTTGHGIGLAVHEPPQLRKGNQFKLEPNIVHSVEPGIYLAGWGGVRIEDLVLVTPDGHEILTGANKSGFWN